MWLFLLGAGFLALVIGAEFLVRGASRLASTLGISSLVIGLTVVAFGTSAPELAVSIQSALADQADLALGNVVGSNNFNILLILGLSALITPLEVDQKLVRVEVPLMVGVSLLVWLLARDGSIDQAEGASLFAGLVAYLGWCLKTGKSEPPSVQQQYDESLHRIDGPVPDEPVESRHRPPATLWNLGMVVAGLILLVLGAGWMVDAATQIARRIGVSELVIGLTIVAGGTSLPELATSLVAALRGERDIAVGNIVGSNLFNLLGVLGLTAAVAPGGVAVAPEAIQFDLPVMVAVALACLPIFFTGHRIARWEGALFVAYYVAYVATLVMLATRGTAVPQFRTLMTSFAIPLTAVTLIVIAARSHLASSGNRRS